MRQLKIGKSITARGHQSLDKYLQEIGKISLITTDMEADLARRIREGDSGALETLTKANLRFVVSVAKQYQHNGMTLGDLINEGNLGLMKAAWRFDETRGFKFISYAVWWIRQSIIQALSDYPRIVRLPSNKIGELTKISRAFSALEQKYERDPSIEELSENMRLTSEEIEMTISVGGKHVSVDAPFANGDDNNLLDVLETKNEETPDASLMRDSLKLEISMALSFLNDRECQIICDYYGLNGSHCLSLDEIGNKLDITKERVRQLKDKATKRLRNTRRSKTLLSYLQ